MRVRDAVLKQMEAARQDGTVASPLESRLVLEADGAWLKFLTSLNDYLEELLIASQVSVEPLPAGTEPSVKSDEGALRVVVSRPEGEKCVRCWLVKPTVGRDSAHPGLCERCSRVVAGGA